MSAHAGHEVWSEVAPEITRAEFNRPDRMDPEFLRLLSKVRRASGVPFRIVSDYRPPAQNPGAARSAHMEDPCSAVDLRVLTNEERFRLIQTALAYGIQRIGVYPPTEHQRRTWGKASGSVHLDASEVNPSPRMWMGW